MNFRTLLFTIMIILLSSCGQYEKILKSTDYELKREKALEYFDDGQYVRASELLSQILPRYRATQDAEELSWLNAQCYYGMRDYMMAGAEFRNVAELYPYGKYAEEANFMAAICDYYLAPKPELDQEYTKNAIEGFTLFINRFSSSPRVSEAVNYINELQERLVEKSYLSAKLYYEMKQFRAAIVALNNSLKEFPDTKYREEMMYLKLSSLFLYAENSIAARQTERYQETLDDYYSFMEEFPESSYSKEVARIYQTTSRMLGLDTDND